MSDPAAEQPIQYTHAFTVDEHYQRTLTQAIFLSAFRLPATWIIFGVFGLLLIGLAFLNRSPFVLILWIVLMAIIYVVRFFRTRSALRTAFPIGKVLQSGFGTTHLAVTDGQNATTLAYTSFDEVRVDPELVWLRYLQPRRRVAYPRALFPDAEVDRIRAAIATRAPVVS